MPFTTRSIGPSRGSWGKKILQSLEERVDADCHSLDGNLASGYDTPVNWVDAYINIFMTNDLINANTGVFDPRHMYGVTNQDVFRWPGIAMGTQRMILGLYITTLLMPGIPKV